MIQVAYVRDSIEQCGTCASCGKFSTKDRLMMRVRIGGAYQATAFCLCDDCCKKMHELMGEKRTG